MNSGQESGLDKRLEAHPLAAWDWRIRATQAGRVVASDSGAK